MKINDYFMALHCAVLFHHKIMISSNQSRAEKICIEPLSSCDFVAFVLRRKAFTANANGMQNKTMQCTLVL